MRRGLLGRTLEQERRADSRLPRHRALQPIIGCGGIIDTSGKSFFRSFDDAALAGLATDQREDHRARHGYRLEPMLRLPEISAGLEHLAQQVVRRAEADWPCAQRVCYEIIWPQPRLACAPPKRRLVDGGREAGFRASSQRARVARPRDVEEFARDAAQ